MEKWKSIQQKIQTKAVAIQQIEEWKKNKKKVGFTNGCFDILHRGHVTYLAKTADLCDCLILGLNSDKSVKRQNKGTNRPINDENSRALVLASLAFVDLVIIFEEDTPLQLIQEIYPNILVKGADYDPKEENENHPRYIVGSKEVKANGGKVFTIDLEDGFSTTNLIKKIKND